MNEIPFELEQAVRRMSTLLVTDDLVRDGLRRIVAAAVDIVDGCDAASVSLLLEGEPTTAAASDRSILEVDLAQYRNDSGPCLDAARTGSSIRIDYWPADERYQPTRPSADALGISSSLSLPLRMADGRSVGSLNLYSSDRGAFDADENVAAEFLAAQAAALLETSELLMASSEFIDEAQLEGERRTTVAQAEGVLMVLQQCSLQQARGLLQSASRDRGRTLVEVARSVLASLDLN